MFFPLDLSAELDLKVIHAVCRQRDPRGEEGLRPGMMVLLLPYAYGIGLSSSHKIVKACWEEAAFRVLTGNQLPDHSRINDFRRRHLDGLAGLVVQAMRLRQTAGLVNLGHVALDGTKVKARASKHKAMRHERMLQPRGLLRSSGASGSWRARCVRCCAKPRSSMPRRTGSTARANGATSCLQSCGAAIGHHAALVVPTGERRTLRGWRSRPPRREAWYHQSSVRGAIGWRCRAATLEACQEKELNA